MNPSNKERQLQQTCQLYAYLLQIQGKEVPEVIEECSQSYDYLLECRTELAQEIANLDSDNFNKILKNPQSIEAKNLLNWWEMHKEADKLRKVFFSDV